MDVLNRLPADLLAAQQLSWFLARATGIVAWGGLTLSVVLGLALSTRALGRRPTTAWLNDLHRGVSASAVVFTAGHLASLAWDEYVQFGLREFLVPMASTWRPFAVTLGVVATYLLLVVELSSLARRSLSARLWRMLHLLAFPSWMLATGHFVLAGTDANRLTVAVLVLASLVGVGGFALVRLLVPRSRRSARSGPRQERAQPLHVPAARGERRRAEHLDDASIVELGGDQR